MSTDVMVAVRCVHATGKARRRDQSDKCYPHSRIGMFHWRNHKGWMMSHHFSHHEHRKQSPRHKERDTGNKVQEFTRTGKVSQSYPAFVSTSCI